MPSCSFCKNINHRDPMAYSHFVKDKQGNNTCPRLEFTTCQKCGLKGHTRRYCKTKTNKQKTNSLEVVNPIIDTMIDTSHIDTSHIDSLMDKEDKTPEEEEEVWQYVQKEAKKISELEDIRSWHAIRSIKKNMTLDEKLEKLEISSTNSRTSDTSSELSNEENGNHCGYCKHFDENDDFYKTHITRDLRTSELICPRLKAWKCKGCGEYGHTPKYCEKLLFEKEQRETAEYLKEHPDDPLIIVLTESDFESDYESD